MLYLIESAANLFIKFLKIEIPISPDISIPVAAFIAFSFIACMLIDFLWGMSE